MGMSLPYSSLPAECNSIPRPLSPSLSFLLSRIEENEDSLHSSKIVLEDPI